MKIGEIGFALAHKKSDSGFVPQTETMTRFRPIKTQIAMCQKVVDEPAPHMLNLKPLA
ncbi:MAG: hypothetical protein AAF989_06880 [Planctomycetota bacterium]